MSNQKITCQNGNLSVPNNPIIPFIEGDGTGADIWAASVRVFDAAVQKLIMAVEKLNGERFWLVKSFQPNSKLVTTRDFGCH